MGLVAFVCPTLVEGGSTGLPSPLSCGPGFAERMLCSWKTALTSSCGRILEVHVQAAAGLEEKTPAVTLCAWDPPRGEAGPKRGLDTTLHPLSPRPMSSACKGSFGRPGHHVPRGWTQPASASGQGSQETIPCPLLRSNLQPEPGASVF